jgi:DNA-binding HxlR family transcriptional regulator
MQQSEIDAEIIIRLSAGETPTREIVRSLLPVTAESTIYNRIRKLEAVGLVNRSDTSKTLSLTPDGLEILAGGTV